MSSSAAKKNITFLRVDPDSATALESLYGSFSVLSFILTWLASCSSLVILAIAVYCGYRSIVAAIFVVTVAAYLPWEHGFISRKMQSFIYTYHPSYYNGVQLIFEEGDLPESVQHRNTFFSVHPHGAFCIGWSMLVVCPAMHPVRFCFAPSLLASPFFRLFSRCVGKPGSASKNKMNSYMRNGEDVALPPGGFEEATLASPSQDRVFIKKRFGFVKLALKHGYCIRPVYVFGEKDLFANVQGMWSTRLSLNGMGVPAILVLGRWFFPLLPRNKANLYIVVGRPIILPQIKEPTRDDVALWHTRYIDELKRMFDEHKEAAYGPVKGKKAKLEIW